MTRNQYFKALIAGAGTMLLLDIVWLTSMAPWFYDRYIGHLLAESPDFLAAGLFYTLYLLGIFALVIKPGLDGNWTLKKVWLTGVMLGLVAYGTYDLTNQATLRDWPVLVTIVDMIWGAGLTGIVSLTGVWFGRTADSGAGVR